MRNSTQANGRRPFSTRPDRKRLAGAFPLLSWVCFAGLLVPGSVFAQSFRLGGIDWFMQAKTDVAYDSNVDDAYPEEEDPFRDKADFYWMPGLTLRSAPWVTAPRTTYNVDAGVAYQDYFARNDLDTALYNAQLAFQSASPRLTLGGLAGVDYAADSIAETYVPGGVGRDPTLTHRENGFASLLYRGLRMDARAGFTSERHDLEKYWEGDNDETVFSVGAQLTPLSKLILHAAWDKSITLFTLSGDETEETGYAAGATLNLFSWGGLYYDWERTITVEKKTDATDEDTTTTFGVRGTIPVELLRHPQLSYSLGLAYEEETQDSGEVVKTWEPVHTLSAIDDFQISKSFRLAGSATWKSEVDTDEISFTYDFLLEQQLGPNIRHALTFSQEPEATFGSTTETKTTTYGYDFRWNNLLVQNLSLKFNASYEESTPLEEENAETEKTTMVSVGLNHVRPLTRKLSRIISYEYTRESSNFHDFGAQEKHLAIYGFTYDF